jgi:hypothetical protein
MLISEYIQKEEKGRTPKKSGSLRRRPLWILTSSQNNQMYTLTLDPDIEGGYLAVFSFKEEAEAFLSLLEGDQKSVWRSRQTTAGELASILLGPCAGVRWVTLDPLPLFSTAMLSFVSVSRKRFVQDLLEEHKWAIGKLVSA